jgi:hypothetical protein
VRPEDWHLRPRFGHLFRECGPVPPVSTEMEQLEAQAFIGDLLDRGRDLLQSRTLLRVSAEAHSLDSMAEHARGI